MKYLKNILLFLSVCVMVNWSCKKYTYDEALPKVQFVSAVSNGSDSLILTAKIISQGASPVENVGFAYYERPDFDILVNQVAADPSSGTFSVIVPAVPDSTYYIKCFATNEYGYTATSNAKYTMPVSNPQTAPCAASMKLNTVVDNGSTYTISSSGLTSGSSYSSVALQCSQGPNTIVTIYFNATPVNGIYRLIDPNNLSGDTNPFDCAIEDYNYNTTTNGNGYVYIAVSSGSNKSTVSFCNIYFSGPGYSISGYASY